MLELSPQQLPFDPETERLQILANARSMIASVHDNPDLQYGDWSASTTPDGGAEFTIGTTVPAYLGIKPVEAGYEIALQFTEVENASTGNDGSYDLINQVSRIVIEDKQPRFSAHATRRYYEANHTPKLPSVAETPREEAFIHSFMSSVRESEGKPPTPREIKPASRSLLARFFGNKTR